MSQNKFTPGPWLIRRTVGGKPYQIETSDGVGITQWRGISRPASADGEANAQLISAAPDMLAALEKGISRLETCIEDERYMRDGSMTYLLEIFKEAVAKARGDHGQA